MKFFQFFQNVKISQCQILLHLTAVIIGQVFNSGNTMGVAGNDFSQIYGMRDSFIWKNLSFSKNFEELNQTRPHAKRLFTFLQLTQYFFQVNFYLIYSTSENSLMSFVALLKNMLDIGMNTMIGM